MKNVCLNFIAVFFAAFLFTACKSNLDFLEQDEGQEIEIPANMDDVTFVSLQQATEVAKAFFGRQTTLKSTDAQKRIVSTETIKDKENSSMYVMNYADGGWVIVGSTRNYYPILAYSDENSFELTEDMGPVTVWLEETKEAIRTSDALPDSVKFSMQAGWNNFEADGFQMLETSKLKVSDPALDAYIARMNQICQIYPSQGYNIFPPLSGAASYIGSNYNYLLQKAISCGANPNYSIVVVKKERQSTQVGPLLATQWHQNKPYNELCGSDDCPAGCVTIAIAQIMRFHEYPAPPFFNWGNIPLTGTPTYDTKFLISTIGNRMGLNYNPSNCDTGATPTQARNTFWWYGYNATLKNHNETDVINEIATNKRPVYMRGMTNQILGIPCGDGHAWVCDGTENYQYVTKYFIELQIGYSYVTYNWCGTVSNPLFNVTQTGTNMHMNWGWQYTAPGWYISNNYANTPNGNFQYGRENIYVHP